MPVPSAISDLSTTPGLNSPAGSESPTSIDDYLRAHAAFIRQVSDASVNTSGDQTIAGTKTFSSPIAGSITGNAATATAANTIALTNDGTTNAAHYLTFADGTAGQENLKTDTSKLAYNPSTGDLTGQSQVGDVKYTARNTAPPGWLKANGAAVSRTAYAALFSAIGTTFGAGDGSTTFNLPKLNGEFIRGWDDGAGVDPGRVFGSTQGDELRSHTHAFLGNNANGRFTATGSPGMHADIANATSASGGSETRPRNVALLSVIKY